MMYKHEASTKRICHVIVHCDTKKTALPIDIISKKVLIGYKHSERGTLKRGQLAMFL